jgi:hypothetical protein
MQTDPVRGSKTSCIDSHVNGHSCKAYAGKQATKKKPIFQLIFFRLCVLLKKDKTKAESLTEDVAKNSHPVLEYIEELNKKSDSKLTLNAIEMTVLSNGTGSMAQSQSLQSSQISSSSLDESSLLKNNRNEDGISAATTVSELSTEILTPSPTLNSFEMTEQMLDGDKVSNTTVISSEVKNNICV